MDVVKEDSLRRVTQWLLAGGLFVVAVLAQGAYAPSAAVLAGLNAWVLWRPSGGRVRLPLSLTTVFLAPSCGVSAGLGAGAILGALFALPELGAAVRSAGALDRRPVPALRTGEMHEAGRAAVQRHLLPVGVALIAAGLLAISVGVASGRWAPVASGIVLLIWLSAHAGFIALRSRRGFVSVDATEVHALAGRATEVTIRVQPLAGMPCALHLSSPVPWVKIEGRSVSMHRDVLTVMLRVTPPLAGPLRLVIDAVTIDPWGLIETRQRVPAAQVVVIPRARYAMRLAQRYLDRTGSGQTSLLGSPRASLVRSLRWGEYYGVRPYAPGDTSREIDWKHTVKFRQFIAKDFRGALGHGAILLVRLDAPDADSLDRLTYAFLTTVLTLAENDIPLVLAGYSRAGRIRVTPVVRSRHAVKSALQLEAGFTLEDPTRRVLAGSSIGRLRRLRRVLTAMGGAQRLAGLVSLEVDAAVSQAGNHPATAAAREAIRRMPPPASVLTLSAADNDTTVLDVVFQNLGAVGYRTAAIAIDGRLLPLVAPSQGRFRGGRVG